MAGLMMPPSVEEAEGGRGGIFFSEAASSAAAAADIRLEKEGAEAAAAPNGSPTPPEREPVGPRTPSATDGRLALA